MFFSIGLILINQKNIEINGDEKTDLYNNSFDYLTELPYEPKGATTDNHENIDSIFDAKLNDYGSNGYFPQTYEPSLQATYYALYILDAIGKLNQINETAIKDYIMAHYNDITRIFLDKYAQRYLDTDIDLKYYPWTSVLEVNCYAILSLDILGQIDIIDGQASSDFIWTCYNPITSGFVGQPYDDNLPEYLKISLMDNTYYAVKTYDLLAGGDWSLKITEQNNLIAFINGLQSTDSWEARKGGFDNNAYTDYDYFATMFSNFDPNLFSSYYCMKTLEVFGGADPYGTISKQNFESFLGQLYRPGDYFIINYFAEPENPMDLVATGLGVELSGMIGYTGINYENAIDYILNNKNMLGGWDSSVSWNCYELIDTFQIIRSLKNIGELSSLSENDKNNIVLYLNLFEQYRGYALISKDYTSLTLIYSIVNSFSLYNRLFSDLDISSIYDSLLRACRYFSVPPTYHSFAAITKSQGISSYFRSFPIECYNEGFHDNIEEIDIIGSNKATFMALDVMLKMLKLDDFEQTYDLNDILQSIIDSQFLNPAYSNYGAFLPLRQKKDAYSSYPEIQNKMIFFEYSYYAIKSLELLSSFLGLGEVKDLGFDVDALFSYIENNFIGYFDPQYSNDIEIILQNTYYMIEIYKVLKSVNLDAQKINSIRDYVIQNIDYSNIKNIYYSFKISNILDLDISFNLNDTYDLIEQLYSEQLNEYYLTLNRNDIDQEIFLWICDMAQNDDITILYKCDSTVKLGESNSLKVWLRNIVLKYFGPLITVKFESEQLGTFILEENQDQSFQENITIPVDSSNYATITGNITVYESDQKINELAISFNVIKGGVQAEGSDDDDDDDDEGTVDESKANFQAAIPLMITIIAIPSCIVALTTKLKRRSITYNKE